MVTSVCHYPFCRNPFFLGDFEMTESIEKCQHDADFLRDDLLLLLKSDNKALVVLALQMIEQVEAIRSTLEQL
jgi:hypothetical protein